MDPHHRYQGEMRAALHLLLAVCVLLCALGIVEPGEAAPPGGGNRPAIAASEADPASSAVPDDADPQIDHHHCPHAPALPAGQVPACVPTDAITPMGSRPIPMTSLTRAPPLQPPSLA